MEAVLAAPFEALESLVLLESAELLAESALLVLLSESALLVLEPVLPVSVPMAALAELSTSPMSSLSSEARRSA